MGQRIDDAALNTLFREARSFSKGQKKPIPDETLRELYELFKLGPTSANAEPARFAFLRTRASSFVVQRGVLAIVVTE